MSQILEDSGKMDLLNLKSNFRYRANLETVKHIARVSNKMNILTNNLVQSTSMVCGDIGYTIVGK